MATWAKSPQYQGMPHKQYMQTAEGQKAGQFFRQDAQRMQQGQPQYGPAQNAQASQPYGAYAQQSSFRPGQAQPANDPYAYSSQYGSFQPPVTPMPQPTFGPPPGDQWGGDQLFSPVNQTFQPQYYQQQYRPPARWEAPGLSQEQRERLMWEDQFAPPAQRYGYVQDPASLPAPVGPRARTRTPVQEYAKNMQMLQGSYKAGITPLAGFQDGARQLRQQLEAAMKAQNF